MIYRLLRPFFRFCLRQFFSAIKIKGAPCEQGPVLFVSNHPNFALDALLIASSLNRELWFLAKSTLFRRELLSRFFKACHMVPVYRRMDSAGGAVDNDETFRVAVATLSKGDALVIFPEGISMGERRLLPLKTGAARIAFQTEEAGNFKLGLRIQPVGLTYTDLGRFKASVTVTFGEPVEVSKLKKDFENDAIQAVRGLTDRIEEGLKSVSVEVKDASHIDLIEKITAIYRSRDPSVDDHVLMRTIAENVEAQGAEMLAAEDGLRSRVSAYLDIAGVFALDDNVGLAAARKDLPWMYPPFVLFGVLVHYLPYRLVGVLVQRIQSHPVQAASYRFGIGLAVFLAWYLLLTLIFAVLIGGLWSTLLFAAGLLILGYITNNYLNQFKLYFLSTFWPGKKKPVDILIVIRDQLIQELDGFRVK